MKHITFFSLIALSSLTLLAATCSNANDQNNSERNVSEEAKAYWYNGQAEISSYKLTQARYGETHEGTAVLLYVTEPFSKSSNTKADSNHEDNVPVLKLNTSKKFLTGIYPYSMMNTTFFPFENGETSLKMATSIQEWCGMAYLEMKNNGKLIFNLNTYFEGTSFKDKMLNKTILEDDLWSLLRLNPELLPTGEQKVIPSAFFCLLRHKEVKAYNAVTKLFDVSKDVKHYEITYPELKRTMVIKFKSSFPNSILGWEETYPSGYGSRQKDLTTKAELIETIKTDYWNKNHPSDTLLRTKLGL